MLMAIIGWAVLGLFAGAFASKIVNLRGDDPRVGIIVGGVGALIGGWLYSWISGTPAEGFKTMTLIVAAIGAVAVLVPWHLWRKSATT